ncbi:hypothetical protein [Cupriavidus necator]|uniref:hypothetical protein n=1 Tax=Cupriavidus necator TaxID=106590 RepID=UPI0027806B6A|nr:hypothetical protein [Cupriavidus necator]MDQ0141451.1 hypothetical protein [Cupriavidus necator]
MRSIYDHNYHDYDQPAGFSYAGIPGGNVEPFFRGTAKRFEAADVRAVRARNGDQNLSIRPMGLERRLGLAYT